MFVQLANEFCRMGVEVSLVLATRRGPYLNEVAAGVRIVDLGAKGVLSALPRLIRCLRSERPDVLLSALDHSNVAAVLACRMSGSHTRCIISMRSVPSAVYANESRMRGWVLPALMRRLYPRASGVIANSQVAADDLIGNFGVPAQKISVIYNPLDLGLISTLAAQKIDLPWLSENRTPLILAVGSLSKLKDFPTLICAFAIVRSKMPCRLAILGQGPDLAALEDQVRELNLRPHVWFGGFLQNPFSWMRAASVVVSSSLTEGCPNVLMQALACGSAIVSTDSVGGSSELLQGGRWGRLVPVGDSQAMADAIEETLRASQHVDVQQRAAEFAMGRIARQYLKQLLPDQTPLMAEA